MGWNEKVERLLKHSTSKPFFGTDLLHVPQIGEIQSVKGIWSDVYISADPQDGISVTTSDPNIGVLLSDFNTPPQKRDRFRRGDRTYLVVTIEKDGEGGATILLEEVTQ